MYLSDATICEMVTTRRLGIEPFDPSLVQPASVDCRLGGSFKTMAANAEPIDPYRADEVDWTQTEVFEGCSFVLSPGAFVLGHTLERYCLPADLVGRVEGKSSLGRLGLLVHITAGFIDPGFEGQVVLEFSNVSPRDILLWPGMKVGQMSFVRLDQAANNPYGSPALNSKYQGQMGARASMFGRARSSELRR